MLKLLLDACYLALDGLAKYFKIKECLYRCGNNVLECNKEETKNILFSFLNLKIFLEK